MRWGTDEQQRTYLPAFTEPSEAGVPAASLALAEPAVLFDVLRPSTTAVRQGAGYVVNGTKALVARGAEAELFVVGAGRARRDRRIDVHRVRAPVSPRRAPPACALAVGMLERRV
ncbi:hypothetical protein JCM18899A_41620 [Nocardioides sp. AN3]